jgi:hypothetical protein
LAWSGFHYRFTAHGVEISTLGFRLRSIPLQNIKAYAVAPWNLLYGYGFAALASAGLTFGVTPVFVSCCRTEKYFSVTLNRKGS